LPEVDSRLAAALGSRYRLERELGRGGTATVYLAQDLRHPRQVAIKVLRPEFVLRGSVERFLREIGIAAHLQHPHILPLLDSGELDGFLYFAMPFVDGETLRDRLRRDGQLAVPDILRILGDVVDAVGHAHARGVVHRDLKPENILLSGRHALVTDFGVARALSIMGDEEGLTHGVAIGTPAYMSPEQATAAPETDHRVDIYALGVLAYELLAGRPPFTGPTAQEILTSHVVLTPEPVTSHRADTPAGLAAIIGRCLQKQPGARYPDAAALLADLDPLVTPSGGLTPARTTPVRVGSGRFPWVVAGVMAAALGLGVFAVASRPGSTPVSGSWRQLTFRGDLMEVALSPDGQFLSYGVSRDTIEELFVHDLRNGAALLVDRSERVRRLAWSADGAEVLFRRRRDSVEETVVVPRLGGTERILPSGVQSPDGRWSASLPVNGGRHRFFNPANGDSTIVQLDVGRRLAGGFSWSPSSRHLVVRTVAPGLENAGFWVVIPSTGRATEILSDSTMLTEPAWSSDGSALFYLRTWRGVASVWRLAVGSGGAARGRPEMITSGVPEPDLVGLLTSRPSVGPGDERLIYKSMETRSNLATLALTGPPSGRGLRPLTSGTAAHPDARFSNDGSRIALTRVEGQGTVVGVMPRTGGPLQVVARMSRAWGVAWSPDGSAILVAGVMPDDTAMALHRFSLEGGPHRAFLHGRTAADIEWLWDDKVVYQRIGSKRFGVLDLRSGVDTVIHLADTVGWVFQPRAAPDRKRLVYAWNRETGRQEMWALPLPGDTPVRLSDPIWLPLRLAAGGTIYAVRNNGIGDAIEVATVPAGGGLPTPLVGLPPGTQALDVSLDGSTLLITIREKRSDAWEVTLPPRR
jgi:Tol biopolymer transport system component